MLYLPFVTNKMERFSFKSGCVIRVENGEMCTSYSQQGKVVLAIYIAAKDVLPALHYYQDGVY